MVTEWKTEGKPMDISKYLQEGKKYYVAVEKIDAQNPNKKLKGAEITLFTKDGKVAKDIHGKDCVGLTDGKGLIIFEVEYNEDMGGYYVKETNAPQGYRINHKQHKVVLSEDYNFAKENPVKIVVNDEALPMKTVKTGDNSHLTVSVGMIVASLGGFFLALKKHKEFNKD